MSYNCCSRNFSSCSLGGHLRYSGSSCGSSFPRNLVYSTDLCPRSSCQLGSSLRSQETYCEPIRTQTFRVVSRPCQTSCRRRRTSTFSSPCKTTHHGSLGCKSSSCSSLSSGSRRSYSVGCGSRVFRPLGYGVCGFPSLGCGSRFWHPINFPCRSFH
uniref:Keratin-associated protein n=1 Tax=Capra hircus TaxID=9925 RepID=J9XT02_CAPHI|nr:keratin-associated protein KAP13-3 [Capra hircus]